MGISSVFSNYTAGIKLIEKSLKEKSLNFNSKKITKYGDKILNTTYLKIIKYIQSEINKT